MKWEPQIDVQTQISIFPLYDKLQHKYKDSHG